MTGKMKLGSPAFSGHRPWAVVWPMVSTEGSRRRLDIETGRLLLDDGGTLLRHPAAGNPLPLRLMQHIQYYADPSVAAVSTVLVVISLFGLVLFGRMLRKRDIGNLA